MIKRNIPNAITCGNLLCGCLAIVKAFEGDLVWAAYLVGIALVLDFFDGFTARLLKVASPIGKDLDSLADMVTFGVVPGIVMYQMISLSENMSLGFRSYQPWEFHYLQYVSFIIPIFSAIRLAKFNNDTRQSDSFIGVPTPANAMVICSLPLFINFPSLNNPMQRSFLPIDNYYGTFELILLNPFVLCLVSLVMSLLLIAPLPLLALKFKNFSWADNKMRFILIGLSVACLAVFKFVGIPLVIILYILLSIVNNIFFKKKV